jgi:hypothetical protein
MHVGMISQQPDLLLGRSTKEKAVSETVTTLLGPAYRDLISVHSQHCLCPQGPPSEQQTVAP